MRQGSVFFGKTRRNAAKIGKKTSADRPETGFSVAAD